MPLVRSPDNDLRTNFGKTNRGAIDTEGLCYKKKSGALFPLGEPIVPTIAESIETNATGPAKASGDSSSVEQHKLTDQIAADKHLAGQAGVNNPKHRGLRLNKLVPPGAD